MTKMTQPKPKSQSRSKVNSTEKALAKIAKAKVFELEKKNHRNLYPRYISNRSLGLSVRCIAL